MSYSLLGLALASAIFGQGLAELDKPPLDDQELIKMISLIHSHTHVTLAS